MKNDKINDIGNLTRCLDKKLSLTTGFNETDIDIKYFSLVNFSTGELITEGYNVVVSSNEQDEENLGYFPRENLYELSKYIDKLMDEARCKYVEVE